MSDDTSWINTITGFLFGSKLSQKEMLREYKYILDHTCREIEREQRKLKNCLFIEMKTLETNIRKGESPYQSASLVINYERQIKGYSSAFIKLKNLEQSCQNLTISTHLATSLCKFTDILNRVNQCLDLDGLTSAMASFEQATGEMSKKDSAINKIFGSISNTNSEEISENPDTAVNNLIQKITEKIDKSDRRSVKIPNSIPEPRETILEVDPSENRAKVGLENGSKNEKVIPLDDLDLGARFYRLKGKNVGLENGSKNEKVIPLDDLDLKARFDRLKGK